jgi:hypothetical protein
MATEMKDTMKKIDVSDLQTLEVQVERKQGKIQRRNAENVADR